MLSTCSRILVTLALLLLAACESAPGARRLERVSPFGSLGVRLGDSPGGVRRKRPAAKLAPYAGLDEELDGRQIIYWFPNTGERGVAMFDRMNRITVTRVFVRDSLAARRELLRETARIAASLSQPPQCAKVLNNFSKADVRTWSSQGYELSVGVWSSGRPPSDTVNLVYTLGSIQDGRPHVTLRECTEADRIP
jgi:hypothetical protein